MTGGAATDPAAAAAADSSGAGLTGSGLLVGVDVGGTFTDVFFYDPASGRSAVAKVPSTRGDQSVGFLEGIGARVDDLARVATVVHGTTVGTNALLERKGARSGLITTAGFRDVLEMRRRDRPRTWGLVGSFEPVIPRDLRLEVAERTLADGTVRRPVDPAEVAAAARTLLERGAEVGVDRVRQRLRQPGQTRRRRWRRCGRCGRTPMSRRRRRSCRRSGSSSGRRRPA